MNLPSADNPVLAEAVERLVRACGPDRIYLFGSAARGDAGPDSDYDFMVIVPDAAPLERKDCGRAYLALRGLGIPKDVLVWTRTAFDEQLRLRASLPSTVVREGRLLYAA
jgi:predicted nucleotidyltransferase